MLHRLVPAAATGACHQRLDKFFRRPVVCPRYQVNLYRSQGARVSRVQSAAVARAVAVSCSAPTSFAAVKGQTVCVFCSRCSSTCDASACDQGVDFTLVQSTTGQPSVCAQSSAPSSDKDGHRHHLVGLFTSISELRRLAIESSTVCLISIA